MNPLIYTLIIGAACGWLAGFLQKGEGFGLIGNIVIGILGSFVGSWLFRQLGLHIGSDLTGHIITSVVGALVVLFLVGLVRKS